MIKVVQAPAGLGEPGEDGQRDVAAVLLPHAPEPRLRIVLVTRRDAALIAVLAFAICVCASLVPALYASSLAPAKALQEEN